MMFSLILSICNHKMEEGFHNMSPLTHTLLFDAGLEGLPLADDHFSVEINCTHSLFFYASLQLDS